MSAATARVRGAYLGEAMTRMLGGGAVMAAAVSPTAATGSGRLRILVIEDERDLTDLLAYNLQREGYEPLIAHDGQEGLRKAQTLLPDLIILDLMLPGLSG